ncbi:uncharacterized protein TRAVEDRAFT_29424 [Trametes versicolor FP-101664 SS1]|uniref:uncharacterized protein n=1 Tax=Trametes versicolor (strain FP-101664) TaxID=717944 RepID=UPI00046216B5|nr:uncharacterized protein TRAVEDRAFT_29424 [Trametes versicolor FP-101664 SS1]EIW57282.1 hypothetical protein TRAVEDRAFT_29424 [Trametes versicolor FP-101664 SS1]
MHSRPELSLAALLILSWAEDYVLAEQYTAVPRWGQAAALVNDALFVQGGRTDQFNAFGYSSAPVTNDILLLPLNATFDLSSPPWQYLAGCSNCSSSQGPAVAWHTLSAFNTTNLLLFGGDAGPNGPIADPEEADSAALLDVADPASPVWELETESWASEPLRRIYHSASSTDGKIWLVGGEKTDGSQSAFSDHYVYDPAGPSFTQLPTTNGPPDILGHTSIVLSDQRLLVFGGYSPSQSALLPFSTIWSLDTTQSTLTWSTLSISTSSLPSPRRGFAAAFLDDGKVLIQGGADADMQNLFSDGWVLDTTQSPMVWSAVDALSQLGPRRDHFAVALGSEVLFGFGYAQSAPVNASLLLFDASKATFLTSYTPPAAVTSPTSNTVPGPTATGSGSGSGQSPSGTGGGSTGTRGGSSPSSTGLPGSGGNGSGSPSDGNGDGTTPGLDPAGASSSKAHTTAVAVGVVVGVLGLLAGGAAAYYLSTRRRASNERFHLLSPSDDDESPHLGPIIPVARAGANNEKRLPVVQSVRETLAGWVPGRTARHPKRRDMLAEEDTRMFDEPGWYHVHRDGSIGSWSTGRPKATIGDVVQGSLTSLRNVGGAMLAYAAGTRSSKNREASGTSSATYWEKDSSYEPYSDKAALVGLTGLPQAAARPKGGRKASYTSQWSYYEDPFAEYDVDSFKLPGDDEYDSDPVEFGQPPSLEDPPPRSHMYARAMNDVTRLSPLSEKPSLLTVSDPSASSDSSHAFSSPVYTNSSAEQVRSPAPSATPPHSPRRPSSIIDANPPITASLRRSDSWWSKFAKTPLLERLSTDSSRTQRPLDFRDPNPPPRTLVPIKESSNSLSPDEPPSRQTSGRRRDDPLYASVHHGRSASSLQTSRTADSEMIEKMGHTMDIVQKGTVSSHASTASSGSGSTAEPGLSPTSIGDYELGALAISIPEHGDTDVPGLSLVQSPTAMSPAQAAGSSAVRGEPRRPSPPRRLSVAERIAALEQHARRPPNSPPPPSRSKKSRSSVYGLAPKPSLFVANPDRRNGSGDS